MGLADILRTISTLISVYILLIFLRILLSWLDGLRLGKAGDYLAMVTDPFLGIFRPLKFLQLGGIDFSPLAAMFMLAMVSSLLNMIADSLSSGQPFSISLVIILALSLIWGGIFQLLLFFLVLCVIRAGSFFLSRNPMGGRWGMLDSFIGPLVHGVEKGVARLVRRSISYSHILLVSVGVLVVVMLVGGILVSVLAYAIDGLNI